ALLERAGSVGLLVTEALLVTEPAAVGVTTSVTVALAPGANDCSMQFAVTVPAQTPWLAVADANVVPAGTVSLTTTPEAYCVPLLLCAVSVYESGLPANTGSGESAFESDTSAVAAVQLGNDS